MCQKGNAAEQKVGWNKKREKENKCPPPPSFFSDAAKTLTDPGGGGLRSAALHPVVDSESLILCRDGKRGRNSSPWWLPDAGK